MNMVERGRKRDQRAGKVQIVWRPLRRSLDFVLSILRNYWRLLSEEITWCDKYFKGSTISVAGFRVSRMRAGD